MLLVSADDQDSPADVARRQHRFGIHPDSDSRIWALESITATTFLPTPGVMGENGPMSSRRQPSHLTGIAASRYRCFRDPFSVELGRLTLVYGENNSGKSALVRLPALVAESRKPGREGLVSGASRLAGASPRASMWRGALDPSEDADLVLGLTLSSGTRWQWKLERRGDAGDLRVAEISVGNGKERPSVLRRVNHPKGGGERDSGALFEVGDARVALMLDGLIPNSDAIPVSAGARNELHTVLNGIRWLESSRVGPPIHGTPVGGVGVIWGDGAEAKEAVFSNPTLLTAVSTFYETGAGSVVTKVSDTGDLARLVLSPVRMPGIAVSFPESGAGLQHIFPIVVALEQIRQDGGMLIVEEPESHLHPRLQRKLADHIVGVLESNRHASVLIETHSEVFLLAALEAAIERLAKDVRLHWIEPADGGASAVVPILLDKSGRPNSPALEQAFDTMGVMRRALIDLRRRHGG